jgi:hypothetical protein
MKRFGKYERDEVKSKKLAAMLQAATERVARDPGFKAKIEDDPEILAELGFGGEGIRTFRLLDNVQTKGICSCSCYPLVSGTGTGCSAVGEEGSSGSDHS